MSHSNTLNNLLQNKTLNALQKGSNSKIEVKALQNILFDLGYGKELNWDKYGADGGYGGSTTAAMTEFLKRNGLEGDGTVVTETAAQRLLTLHDVVDDLRMLKSLQDDNEVGELHRGSSNKQAVIALQTVLNSLGFGAQLNWEKYGADGGYGGGTVDAVKAYAAQLNMTTDGETVPSDMITKMIENFSAGFGDQWLQASIEGEQDITSRFKIKKTASGSKIFVEVSDGEKNVKFRGFKKGVYTLGSETVVGFINNNKPLLEEYQITDSAINVMVAVSENEGSLDAINTWDNCFMTFGMFQWTVGAGNEAGELPALLKKIKQKAPDTFKKYYGQYGLDVADSTDNVYGHVLLNGTRIKLTTEKEQFRTPEWSYIFWRAGLDPVVKAIQIEHALSRLYTFYWKFKIGDFALADIITSEYGVGLILDNHVNRPGYVKPCVQQAMQATGLTNPTNWTTAEELQVINEYIKIRANYGNSPMTDANKRAAVTKRYLDKGIISADRNSFKFTDLASRDANAIGVPPPMDFQQNDYPTIKDFEDDFTDY